jgi:hypothetical protein
VVPFKKSNCEVHCHLEPRRQVSLTSRQGSPNCWEPDWFGRFPVEPGRPGTRTGPVPTHKQCLSFSNPTEPAGFTGLPAGFFDSWEPVFPRFGEPCLAPTVPGSSSSPHQNRRTSSRASGPPLGADLFTRPHGMPSPSRPSVTGLLW